MRDVNKEKNFYEIKYGVSPWELTGLFFMEYRDNNPDTGQLSRWVRSPCMNARAIDIAKQQMDWSNVDNFTIWSMEDLFQPVDRHGFTESECQTRNMEFSFWSQKSEYMFGDKYQINRDTLCSQKRRARKETKRLKEGLRAGDEVVFHRYEVA